MRLMIDVPDNLEPAKYVEVLNKINDIHNLTFKAKSPVGFSAMPSIEQAEDIFFGKEVEMTSMRPKDQATDQLVIQNPKVKKKKKGQVPAYTEKEKSRNNDITKVIRSIRGPSDVKTRLAKTCYKNLTQIYGIVWEQSIKEYKEKWNIDKDVKVSKRHVMVCSTNLWNLYINQLKTMVDHYNRVKGWKVEI